MNTLWKKFNSLKRIDKVSSVFWIIWIISILIFVLLVVVIPHPDIKVDKDGAIRYANILATGGVTIIILLFVALSLTIFPKVKWKKEISTK